MVSYLRGPVRESKVDTLCQALVHLGLRSPSEQAMSRIVTTLLVACVGPEAAFNITAETKYGVLQMVKKRVAFWKAKIPMPVEGLMWSFPSVETFRQMKPGLYDRMYSNEAPCAGLPMDNGYYETIAKSIPLRPTAKALRGTSLASTCTRALDVALHNADRPAMTPDRPMTPNGGDKLCIRDLEMEGEGKVPTKLEGEDMVSPTKPGAAPNPLAHLLRRSSSTSPMVPAVAAKEAEEAATSARAVGEPLAAAVADLPDVLPRTRKKAVTGEKLENMMKDAIISRTKKRKSARKLAVHNAKHQRVDGATGLPPKELEKESVETVQEATKKKKPKKDKERKKGKKQEPAMRADDVEYPEPGKTTTLGDYVIALVKVANDVAWRIRRSDDKTKWQSFDWEDYGGKQQAWEKVLECAQGGKL